jgi:hypothetical protein
MAALVNVNSRKSWPVTNPLKRFRITSRKSGKSKCVKSELK